MILIAISILLLTVVELVGVIVIHKNYHKIVIKQQQLAEIKDCLLTARATLLGQTATDTTEELIVKEMQRQSNATRYIDRCLKFFEK